jgi:hypothetical protein
MEKGNISSQKEERNQIRDREAKGVIITFKQKTFALKPGERFADHSGKKYTIAEDGSLRRIK